MSDKDYNHEIVMVDLTRFSQIYLVPLADFHIGTKDADLENIRGYTNWIAERENAFTLLNGDMMNCATKDSTPELYDDLVTPDDAYFKVRELLMPIKDKILMVTRGNHEEMIWRRVGADYSARLAYDLGDVPYKPDGGMLGLKLSLGGKKVNTFYIYAVHGWGGARTIGAKVKKCEDLGQIADADCYVLSHDHTQNVTRKNILSPALNRRGKSYIITRRRLFINTGGFVKYAGYIQRKGYSPMDRGTPRVRMELKYKGSTVEKDLHASI